MNQQLQTTPVEQYMITIMQGIRSDFRVVSDQVVSLSKGMNEWLRETGKVGLHNI